MLYYRFNCIKVANDMIIQVLPGMAHEWQAIESVKVASFTNIIEVMQQDRKQKEML